MTLIAEPPAATSPAVFRNRNFLLLFSGKIVSQLGDQIFAFALSWYILDLTRSSFQMAVFLALNTLAVALLSPLGGILADRCNRKWILVITDVLQGLVVLAAAFLLHHHLLEVWMLCLAGLVLGACAALFAPAASAIIPNIVDEHQLATASAVNHFVTHFCTMAGMLAGGVLYAWAGVFAIFLFNAASFFLSALLEAAVRLPAAAPQKTLPAPPGGFSRALHEFHAGYRYIRSHQAVYYLLLMNTLFILIALPVGMVYVPYFFNVILQASPLQLAFPQAAIWTGMIAGSVVTPLFLRRRKLKHLILWSFSLLSLFTLLGIPSFLPQVTRHLLTSNWHISIFWTLCNLLCGLLVSFFTIPLYVLFQKVIADDFRGRFWGFENALRTFAMGAGFFLAGFLAQIIWLGYLFLAIALVMSAINLWVQRLRPIRELQE